MIPKYIIAGDTHAFSFSDSTYPATTWNLKFHLVGPSTLTVTGSADGVDFDIVLPATQTSVLKEGTYTYGVRLLSGVEAYMVESGQLQVRPNLATALPKVFIAERMIELIETALTNQLTEGEAVEAISIAGRSISNISRSELLEERGYWYGELNKYRKSASGQGSIKSIELRAGRL